MCDAAATASETATTALLAGVSAVTVPGAGTPGAAAPSTTTSTSQPEASASATATATTMTMTAATTPLATKSERAARQNCCRLCIAPATECISIINSYAADKEPLSTKIHNCVSIKITAQDRLSLHICHACISYLNSWQSFKNRCHSSQTKQRQWLETSNKSKLFNYLDLNSAENGGASSDHQHQQHSQAAHQPQSENELDAEKAMAPATTAANILDGIPSLKKRKSLTVYVSPKPQQLPQHQLQQLQQQLQPPAARLTSTATGNNAQQTLQTLLLQVPASTASSSSTITTTTSVSQQREQQHQRQQSHQYRRYHHHHHHQQQQQQHSQQQQQQRSKQHHHQQQQQQQHRRHRQFRPQRPTTVPVPNPAPSLRKYKPKLYLPLDIAVPPLPPLPSVAPGSIAASASASASAPAPAGVPAAEQPLLSGFSGSLTGIAGVGGGMESLSLSLPLDFSQSCSSGHVQQTGLLPLATATATATATSTSTSNPTGIASATATSGTGSASATASVSTAPLLMPVTLQSAAQQLRFFRRYSYNPLPALPIKDEPIDTDDDYQMKMIDESDDMVDPTMFLERSEHEGDMPLMASEYDYTAQHGVNAHSLAAGLPPNAVANVAAAGDSKVASCRACSLQFSTRANARRHERNLHPNLFQLSTDSLHNTSVTKPTPALAAALEIQRAAAAAATAEANRAVGAAGGNITPQKYRQVVMNAFIKCEGGGYDYDNPEQYRPLLTHDKVEFIEQNEEFLEQYQTMTCRCCSKYFSTYKNFMAHVRKKYPLLPRNLCFNCLKMNDSKALFISHLKKRNCINLYRVLNTLRGKTPVLPISATDADATEAADDGVTATAVAVADAAGAGAVTMASPTVTISGETAATPGERPEKLRAKELLVNKLYECKLCPKGFRTKHEFRTHVYDKHADVQRKDNNSIQCSFCGLDFADPVDRRRHYNNMDCIVRLRCMTCDAKLETHQRFLDHVYQDHLGGVGGGAGGASSDNASTTGSGLARSNSMEHSPGKRSLLGALGIGVGSSAEESRSSSVAPTLTSTPKPAGGGTATTASSASAPSSSNRGDAAAPKSQYFSRMPQVCPICGQQYNNYNNVLRHMESKHPNKLPETYKCVRCGLGYPRISYLREHMINVHGVDKNRHSGGFEYIVNADAVKLADGSTPNVYTGRFDYVMKDLMSITNGGTLDEDDEEAAGSMAKKMRLDDSSNNSSLAGVASQQQKECPICNAVFSNNIGLSNHMRSHYTAASVVTAALAAANRMTPKSLTITATPATTTDASPEAEASAPAMTSSNVVPPAMANQTPQEQAVFRRSLDQAADRRFRRMRCRICQRRFSSKKSYRYHMLTDHQVQNVQFIKCKLCNAEFAYEKGLKVHLFKVHGRAIKDEMIIKQFECEVCSIVYSSELELQQHKRSVHKLTSASASVSASASASASTSVKMEDDVLMDEEVKSTADLSTLSANASGLGVGTPLYWYQCKYCPSNFNTNKKLAIHINSHDEFDSNDYSCKDCGNVYSGRKSLWVHRYKKHPQVPDPAECSLCRKIFFDRQMLDNHTPTCNRKPITSTGAHQQQQQQQLQQQDSLQQQQAALQRAVFRHKTGDDDDEEDDGRQQQQPLEESDSNGAATASAAAAAVAASAQAALKIRIPEVACTICGARFTDQEHFSKHIQKHEQELYVDNPLAAMFDDGPADAGQFQVERQNENGEYACDLCAKTFPQVIALKVHRKWHFRGDSKQNPIDGEATQLTNNNHTTSNNNNNSSNNSMLHLRELHAVGLMPNQQQQQLQQEQQSRSSNNNNMNHSGGSSSSKSMKRKRELKCEYCASTFISNNNLRRHMYELHKHEVSNLPEPPIILVDDHLQCRRCQLSFETKELWIEHKLADAKVVRPFCPFQWGCDLCGEYLSRKEKLMNHINNHLKEEVIVPVATKAAIKREAAAATATAATAANTAELTADEGVDQDRENKARGNKDKATTAVVAGGQKDVESDDLDEEDSSGEEEEESSGTGDDEDDEEDDSEDDEGDGGEGEDEEGVQPGQLLTQQQQQPQQQHNQDDDDLVEEVNSSDDEDDGEVESDDDDDDVGEDDDEGDVDDEDDDVEEPEPVAVAQPLMNGNGKSKMPPLIMPSSDDDEDVDDGVMPIDDIIEEEFDEDEAEPDADPDPDVDDAIEEVDDDDLDEDGDGDDVEMEMEVEMEEEVVSAASSSESESSSTTTSNTHSHSHSHSTGERRKKRADDQLNDPSFTCDLCQLCFDSQELLQSHIKSHFLNGPKLTVASAAAGSKAASLATTTAAPPPAKTKPDSKSALLANNNNKSSKTVAAAAAAATN